MVKEKKLLDVLVDKIRFKHYSKSTEQTYVYWSRSYILYHEKKHPKDMGKVEIEAFRAKQRERIPVVLSIEEVQKILTNITGVNNIIVSLLYGCGLRIKEVLRLRIKDIDFEYNNIYIFDSKSTKDRIVPMPLKLKALLKEQVSRVETIHKKDILDGYGSVFMPHNLASKYKNAFQLQEYHMIKEKISRDAII